MHKVTKRALALLLACTLVFSSGMRSRSYAMAGGGVIAGGGAVIGVETALAYLLGILGFSAASAVVYDNRDSIAKWGKTQVGRLTKYIDEKKDQLNCTAESMQEWLAKLGKGTLDTAAAEWSAVKSWVGTLYDSGGMVDTVITDQADFPANSDGSYNIGKYPTWQFKGHSLDGEGFRRDQICTVDGDGVLCTMTALRTWKDGSKHRDYYWFVVSAGPGVRLVRWVNRYYADTGLLRDANFLEKTTPVSKFGNIYATYVSGDYYGNADLYTDYLVNYVGEIAVDESGKVPTYTPSEESMYVKAYSKYLAGDFDVPKTKAYTKIGGISSAYDAGKTLDNISVVGVGDKAGVTDVTIPWPKDDSFGGLIGGAITGTNTWTDVIGAANVGVIEREGEKDWVIDNTGVTTKEWDYATDIPGTGGTDKPGTGEGDTDVDVPKDLGSYTFAGLEKLFPFCLPFDLIDFIGVLDADPEAPHFVIPIKVPTSTGWGTYDIDIDLSKFDQIAALMRQMETLAFVVGLIMITRQKMIRG